MLQAVNRILVLLVETKGALAAVFHRAHVSEGAMGAWPGVALQVSSRMLTYADVCGGRDGCVAWCRPAGMLTYADVA